MMLNPCLAIQFGLESLEEKKSARTNLGSLANVLRGPTCFLNPSVA